MITITVNQDTQQFKGWKDLYNFMVDHQLITEVGFVSEGDLSEEAKTSLKEMRHLPQGDFVDL